MTSSPSFCKVVLFLLSISSLVLELWQFPFIKEWPEIRNSDIVLSGFCPIYADRGDLGIPVLAQIFLMKCYWMLQNARITAFTVSELLRENQPGGGGSKITPPTQIRLKGALFRAWETRMAQRTRATPSPITFKTENTFF